MLPALCLAAGQTTGTLNEPAEGHCVHFCQMVTELKISSSNMHVSIFITWDSLFYEGMQLTGESGELLSHAEVRLLWAQMSCMLAGSFSKQWVTHIYFYLIAISLLIRRFLFSLHLCQPLARQPTHTNAHTDKWIYRNDGYTLLLFRILG